MKRAALFVLVMALSAASALAQDQSQQAPVIQINVTRTIQAVNYMAKGSTRIDFRGTALLPQATGQAKVEAKNGAVSISANFDNLSGAGQFGAAYLTYVLWAITPEGRANNLGQLVLDGQKSKVQVTTRLQTFGLIVTAEPYYAVSFPSDEVVLENIVRADTKGQVDAVDAKYELLQRSRYKDLNLAPIDDDPTVPLDLLQARNAKRIAQLRGADKYAADSWAKASDALTRAEDYETRKQKKSVPSAARDAVQSYEDAITISLKRQDDERLAKEREAGAQREAQAKADQEAEAQRRALAEKQQAEAEKQQAEAEKQKMQAELAAAKEAQARAEAQKAQAEAEKAQAEALAKQQAAQEQAEREKEAAEKAEREKQELRATLLAQFNKILETRDSPRGLVVNLGDVLFATAKYDLRPEARERLAKLSGIVLAHPGLNLTVEGHTDNVGSDAFNQTLSEQRAQSVRQYLIDQGLDAGTITAQGFGKTMPVADNSTAEGRQKNRRVEIIVSGEVIGTKIGATQTPQQ
ncbi:MAG TPA: OmpA family protein [Candidatus Acidoferrales bacterium]|nr:OmpA family protein [Candidatus Acidoferrales bacterium]